MPEERHLPRERALAFEHAQQRPARRLLLFGEVEVQRGQAGVEVVWRRGGLEQPLDRAGHAEREVLAEVRWGRAEAGTPQQVSNLPSIRRKDVRRTAR